jgi:hypothetical protein
MFLRMHAVAVLTAAVLAIPTRAMGQGSLAELASVMNQHPTVIREIPSVGRAGYHTTVTASEPCSLGVTKRDTLGTEVYHDDFTIPLGQLAPDAEVSKLQTGETWRVRLHSSTGAPVATVRRRMVLSGQPSSREIEAARFELIYQDEGVARAVASGFRRVIAGCGGAPLTQAARDSAAVAAGTDPETTRLKNECRNAVRRQTTDPDAVTFGSPALELVLRSDGKVTYMGDFTGTVQGGSRRQASFACTFVRNGSAWALEGMPLII